MLRPLEFQTTIARPVQVQGWGYFSNQQICVRFLPAGADTGWVFRRKDLSPPVEIPVQVASCLETPRRTALGRGNVQVHMVEHVLAALHALEIHNCIVELDGPELPAGDGSCRMYVEALDKAGRITLGVPAQVVQVAQAVEVQQGESWIRLEPAHFPGLEVEFTLHYPSVPAIGLQHYQGRITPEEFARELAPARTFLLWEEAQVLRAQGVGKRATLSDLLVFRPEGVVGNQLRFADECVRHKVLDLVGDLALAGRPVWGRVVAHRSGHRLNARLVQAVLDHLKTQRRCA